MSQIKLIRLKLKSGLLSELQHDTIFGTFCWRMKEILGEEKLVSFLDLYRKGKPVFIVSNGFLSSDENTENVFFPNPQIPYKYKSESRNKSEKIVEFLNYKEKKKISHINLYQLNELLDGKSMDVNIKTVIPKFDEDLRTSVEIDRDTMTAKKGKLFSYAPKYLNKYLLNVFIKVLDTDSYKDYKCDEILSETFALGFGKKKSSGYGEMEVVEIISTFEGFKEPESSTAFITLSNYLPSVDDKIEEGYYDFHVKYSKLGEELSRSSNPFKRPIIFFKPGSIFKTGVQKEYYGRVTKEKEITHYPGIVQNGIAFTLRIKI